MALALAAGGCGGDDSPTQGEKSVDVELLNTALVEELTAIHAYAHGARLLKGPLRGVGRTFRAHAQEHVSAITKSLRGLGGDAEAEAEELDYSQLRNQADVLALAYELENRALDLYVEFAVQLQTDAPRTLASTLAANHAQHLVVLRQALGAGLAAAVPEALEHGEHPPPPVPTVAVEAPDGAVE